MILVTGAGGFIGGHLVKRLLDDGHAVTAVDIKHRDDWFQVHDLATNVYHRDLRHPYSCETACDGVDQVYNLAADMGGMGFIETHRADCMRSVLINTNLLEAARRSGVKRYFYASSACVYNASKQASTDLADGLREDDAYPAMPEDGYGWEKLFSERMCRHYTEDYGLPTRVARFHNVYGPHGTWIGGREKAPAAICRKVAEAIWDGTGEIEIWGDGKQTRSFMHISDAVEGALRVMNGHSGGPVNLGSEEMVTIDQLVGLVEAIVDVKLRRRYDLDAPKGVRGRCSNNELLRTLYGWEPRVDLATGIRELFAWVQAHVVAEKTRFANAA